MEMTQAHTHTHRRPIRFQINIVCCCSLFHSFRTGTARWSGVCVCVCLFLVAIHSCYTYRIVIDDRFDKENKHEEYFARIMVNGGCDKNVSSTHLVFKLQHVHTDSYFSRALSNHHYIKTIILFSFFVIYSIHITLENH